MKFRENRRHPMESNGATTLKAPRGSRQTPSGGKAREPWSKHPLFIAVVGVFASMIVTLISGYFIIRAAKVQADATISAAKEAIREQEAQAQQNKPVVEDPRHRITLNWSGAHVFDVTSSFQSGLDYKARFEGCYSELHQAICAFSIKPEKTITVTNIENLSHASRDDGSEISTCCLYSNTEPSGSHVYRTKEADDIVISRRTFSPPEIRMFLLVVPDFDKKGKLDSILFSRGQKDPGVEFPVKETRQLPLGRFNPAIASLQKSLEEDPRDGVMGNPEGSVNVVEFTDYRCVFCKQIEPDLQKLLKSNPAVRLVVKELTIEDFGRRDHLSHDAAVLALSSVAQKNYNRVHTDLLTLSSLNNYAINRIAAQDGIDLKYKTDQDTTPIFEHLDDNLKLAKAIGVDGTPTFIVNNRILAGPGIDDLRSAIYNKQGSH